MASLIRLSVVSGIAITAFSAGLAVSPWLQRLLPDAHAQGVLAPAVYDLAAMKEADLAPTPFPELRNKTLVSTDNATIALQIGNVNKHYHAKSDESQYIIEGSGQMWFGNERHEIKPGMLIVIPKGTAHSGTIVTSGPIKTIAIKIPPQQNGDTIFVE